MKMGMDRIIVNSEWKLAGDRNGRETAVRNMTPSVCLTVYGVHPPPMSHGIIWSWSIGWRSDTTRIIKQGNGASAKDCFRQALQAFDELKESVLAEERRAEEIRLQEAAGKAQVRAELSAAAKKFNQENI